MFRTTFKQTLATAIAGAALAAGVGAANAPAMPVDPLHDGYVSATGEQVMPPPSSIAMQAAKEYNVLRTPVGTDVATKPESQPAPVEATAPSSGFDFSSAVIGALGAGMLVVALGAGGVALRRTPAGPNGAARA